MRPELLLAGDLAGDLAGGNLVEQADRTVGLLRQGEGEGLHLLVQGRGVLYQEAGEALALLGRVGGETGFGVGRPEVLLDRVPARPVLALLEVRLAEVELRVEVTEGLGDRFHALPVRAGRGVEAAGGLEVAGRVGGRECVGAGDQLSDLVAHIGGVVDVGGLDPRLEVLVHHDRLVGRGDREPGLADPVAGHAGFAGGDVFALGQLNDQVAGQSRSDVLGLADDPQPVVGEQVELGDLVARVGDAEAEVAGRGFLGRDGAGIRAAVDRDRRPVGTGRGVGDAAGESEQADRGDGGEVQERGAHESP